MKEITREDLDIILNDHLLWLDSHGKIGKKANLAEANLTNANLTRANLTEANLAGANLTEANLAGANLTRAYLTGAILTDANLIRTNLTNANLTRANLTRVILTDTILTDANLIGANLTGVLTDATTSFFALQCPEEGSFIGYKKLRNNKIATLEIPADAKRSSATTRKCRCDKALVLKIEDQYRDEVEMGVSNYDRDFIYKVGEMVTVDDFDDDRWVECTRGIHFFITKQEAKNY